MVPVEEAGWGPGDTPGRSDVYGEIGDYVRIRIRVRVPWKAAGPKESVHRGKINLFSAFFCSGIGITHKQTTSVPVKISL